jgi:muconate cycloisomerase
LKIVSVEAVPLAVSFKRTFRFGTTDRSTSPNVVLVVRTDDDQVGYGEACPVPAFTSETQASVVELIEQRVEPVLIGQDPTRRGPLLADLARVLKFAPFTTAAVDTALLDLTGRGAWSAGVGIARRGLPGPRRGAWLCGMGRGPRLHG